MKIAITAETTVDLSKDILADYDIHTIPLTILLGERMGLDGEITPDDIVKHVDETGSLPKTSAVNEFQYNEFFENLLKEYDAIIHFSISKKFSSCYDNAVRASKNFDNVLVVDSQSLSTGIALLAIYASKLAKKNTPLQTIYKKVVDRVPYVQASFVISSVDYLYKGGRCSALARFGAMLLKIKPQIVVVNGKMEPSKKYFGRKTQVVMQYCQDTLEQFGNPDTSIAFVTHTQCTPEMISAAIESLKNKGFKTIYETEAGSTITSHCGPNCIGILFINDGAQE